MTFESPHRPVASAAGAIDTFRGGADRARAAGAASAYANRLCDQIDRARADLGELVEELADAITICRALAGAEDAPEARRAVQRAERLLAPGAERRTTL